MSQIEAQSPLEATPLKVTNTERKLRFPFKVAEFSLRDEFSDLGSSLVGFLLFPIIVLVIGGVWIRYTAESMPANVSAASDALQNRDLVFSYIALGELLFLTMMRSGFFYQAAREFEIYLVRPRSWLLVTFIDLYTKCMFRRCIYLLLFIFMIPLLGKGSFEEMIQISARFLMLLPLISLVEPLCTSLLGLAAARWIKIDSARFLLGKLFLVLGGVIFPVAELSEPLRGYLLRLPFVDFIFQPVWFAITGGFYRKTAFAWLHSVLAFLCFLFATNLLFYKFLKKNHRSYGG